MLDFKELSKDGNDLELLIREILLTKGYKVQWSGKGPDGGKDLICHENRESEFLADSKVWLLQCKHKAHSGNAVGLEELDDIVDSCNHHQAKGYMLICSTYPSSKVIERLEGITRNLKNDIDAIYWDAVKIEQILSTPRLWRIAQSFFPKSSKNSSWEIYATENPNYWIANYRGYHFHLSNRIGSKVDFHFNSIDDRINEIESIKFPEDHFIRLRAVYFDDKNGCYSWFLDYMYPHDQEPTISSALIAHKLGNGWSLSDGQFYSFDVITRPYLPFSDHYDKDHYDYYEPYLRNYHIGSKRETDFESTRKSWDSEFEIEKDYEDFKTGSFSKLNKILKEIKCARLLRSVNAQIEKLDKFNNQRDWIELINEMALEYDRFLSSWFLFSVYDKEEFFRMISFIPQEIETSYRLTNAVIATPNSETGGSNLDLDDSDVYELTVTVMPGVVHNSYLGRKYINEYMVKVEEAILKYLKSR
ncbi:MAG: restriction endonuclease [Bacteroidota bacterium]